MPPWRPKRWRVLSALSCAALAACLYALCAGASPVGPGEVAASFARAMSGQGGKGVADAVLWDLRAPRVLSALAVGATLAVAGGMMQGLFRNPLADPGLIGVTSGGAVGAVAAILLGGMAGGKANGWWLPCAAMAGSLLATFAVHRLSLVRGRTSVATLLLAGVAANAFGGAAIGLAIFLADESQLRSLNFWMLGSLGSAGWGVLLAVGLAAAGTLASAARSARALDALALGEAEAGHLGVDPERSKRLLLAAAAAGVGACVAHSGMIGFVGLVAPHMVRLAVGPGHRLLLPASALLGGGLLVLADAASRTWAAPAEIPVGIVTSLFGAPFFVWLLRRNGGSAR